jgi:hypothetical protein
MKKAPRQGFSLTPEYARGTALDVANNHGTQQSNLIEWLELVGVRTSDSDA